MKKSILALVAVCAAMWALPAVASAGVWHLEPEDGSTTQTLKIAGSTARYITANASDAMTTGFHCTSWSATGEYKTTTAGTLTMKWQQCSVLGSTCEMESTPLPFENILIHANTPGILIKPSASGKVVHSVCGLPFFGLEGTGFIGQVTLECGATKTSAVLDFAITGNTQRWKQVTTAGTIYQLKRNGEALSFEQQGTMSFPKSSKVACT